ncbi:FAD-dependent oxidoreductase [Candidatus Amarobacter glycogenicus]|uniref:phytoene desaturase family protein n=1 Tax=Candidatus Amarobacter glycogenicus TaxID=3140699 RepID=UPI002A0E1299|nr:FAD-dependent oxidoreductase [Dehalococcoidia bacterium]
MAKWGMTSAREFAAKFQDPLAAPRLSADVWLGGYSGDGGHVGAGVYGDGQCRFSAGGSLAFAQAIERRYLDLGGEIRYKAQVEKILVENGRAVGVRLYNDEIHRADYVISAADGRGTLFDMLGEEFVTARVRKLYDGHLPIHAQILVALGVNRDLSTLPH